MQFCAPLQLLRIRRNRVIKVCKTIVEWPWFERSILSLIVLNGVVLGLETYPFLASNFHLQFVTFNQLVLIVFVVEAVIKIIAVAPRFQLYFLNGWNLFDFTIVVFSLIPQTGEYALIARMVRLLRIMRLITAVPELRLIVVTLIRSLPGLGHVILLLAVLFYIYAIAGYHLFHEHDPFHWNSLGISLITLFRVLTLEDWTDVMYTAMELHHLAWVYFVSFVVVAAFVVINMFIAVVLNNLHKTQQESEITQVSNVRGQIIYELRESRKTLERVERALKRSQQELNRPQD